MQNINCFLDLTSILFQHLEYTSVEKRLQWIQFLSYQVPSNSRLALDVQAKSQALKVFKF